MTVQIVTISAIPAQTFSVSLGGQQCTVSIYQKSIGLFMDLAVDGNQILTAMLCLDRVGLVRFAYLGFAGQLAFVDTAGYSDPYYTGLGSRYILTYTT